MRWPANFCGVDEAGRGPIAGPVCAAAVVLALDHGIKGLADSKLLTPNRRERLADIVRTHALAWQVAWASVEEIDRINILQATLLAMQRAVAGLPWPPSEVVIDGNRCPPLEVPARALVGGDRTHPAVQAASILAKTARDSAMRELHWRHPVYGFDRHKGYPTREHLQLLARHGACEIHRRSFAPVRRVIEQRAGWR